MPFPLDDLDFIDNLCLDDFGPTSLSTSNGSQTSSIMTKNQPFSDLTVVNSAKKENEGIHDKFNGNDATTSGFSPLKTTSEAPMIESLPRADLRKETQDINLPATSSSLFQSPSQLANLTTHSPLSAPHSSSTNLNRPYSPSLESHEGSEPEHYDEDDDFLDISNTDEFIAPEMKGFLANNTGCPLSQLLESAESDFADVNISLRLSNAAVDEYSSVAQKKRRFSFLSQRLSLGNSQRLSLGNSQQTKTAKPSPSHNGLNTFNNIDIDFQTVDIKSNFSTSKSPMKTLSIPLESFITRCKQQFGPVLMMAGGKLYCQSTAFTCFHLIQEIYFLNESKETKQPFPLIMEQKQTTLLQTKSSSVEKLAEQMFQIKTQMLKPNQIFAFSPEFQILPSNVILCVFPSDEVQMKTPKQSIHDFRFGILPHFPSTSIQVLYHYGLYVQQHQQMLRSTEFFPATYDFSVMVEVYSPEISQHLIHANCHKKQKPDARTFDEMIDSLVDLATFWSSFSK